MWCAEWEKCGERGSECVCALCVYTKSINCALGKEKEKGRVWKKLCKREEIWKVRERRGKKWESGDEKVERRQTVDL